MGMSALHGGGNAGVAGKAEFQGLPAEQTLVLGEVSDMAGPALAFQEGTVSPSVLGLPGRTVAVQAGLAARLRQEGFVPRGVGFMAVGALPSLERLVLIGWALGGQVPVAAGAELRLDAGQLQAEAWRLPGVLDGMAVGATFSERCVGAFQDEELLLGGVRLMTAQAVHLLEGAYQMLLA